MVKTAENDTNEHTPLPLSHLGARARPPRADGPQQAVLVWDAAGEPAVTVEQVREQERRRGRELRADARRTAEYLASRGGSTPVESLHDIARMKWRVAIREIAKEARCTRHEAMRMWFQCATALLPYTSARLDTIELGQNAAGTLALAHWLAATAAGDRLMSNEGASFDTRAMPAAQSEIEGTPEPAPALELPPKAPD